MSQQSPDVKEKEMNLLCNIIKNICFAMCKTREFVLLSKKAQILSYTLFALPRSHHAGHSTTTRLENVKD